MFVARRLFSIFPESPSKVLTFIASVSIALNLSKVVNPSHVDRAVSLIVEKRPDLLNIGKDDGFSALHLASLNGHFSVVNALIEVH